jgi:hypothetical protein
LTTSQKPGSTICFHVLWKPFQINANSDPNTNPIPEVTIRRITARTTSNGYMTYIGLMKLIQKTKSITC